MVVLLDCFGPARRVIHCYIFGPGGCGKSSLVWASAGKSSEDMKHSVTNSGSSIAVSVSQMSGEDGRERVLIMTEVSAADILSKSSIQC
jgi:GTPase SAR1 family protein